MCQKGGPPAGCGAAGIALMEFIHSVSNENLLVASVKRKR